MDGKYRGFLVEAGAAKVPHSGRMLLDHLLGTHELLKSWGNEDFVCVAGLFHSVYGTQTFSQSLLHYDQRRKVADVIGLDAEQLVFLFGICDRDGFFENIGFDEPVLMDKIHGRRVAVAPETLRALVEIEIANILEQVPHKRHVSATVMAAYADQCAAARTILSREARRHVADVFATWQRAGVC